MSESIVHVGPVGTSAAFKLANNQLAAALIAAFGESLAMAEACGVPRAAMVEALAATATRVCGLKKGKILGREFGTDFALELMTKDLDQAIETAARAGVAAPLMRAVRERYARACARGRGGLDFAAITEPDAD